MSHCYQLGNCAIIKCAAIFSENYLHVIKNKQVILKGNRNHKDGLWDVMMKTTSEQLPKQELCPIENRANYTCAINYIVQRDKTKLELAQYLHACAFSPCVKTLQACIRQGNFYPGQGLKIKISSQFLVLQWQTLGHLKQERQSLQWTKSVDVVEFLESDWI